MQEEMSANIRFTRLETRYVCQDYAFDSSAPSASSSCPGAVAGALAASFSRADSEAVVHFIAPTKNPVKMPLLNSVLQRNFQVSGQPDVPTVKAVIQPVKLRVYSGF